MADRSSVPPLRRATTPGNCSDVSGEAVVGNSQPAKGGT